MRKIVAIFAAALMLLCFASAALADFKATGGYSSLADGKGNGISFLSGGLRYETDGFMVGGSYAMDLGYNPAPLLSNSDDLLLLYGGPRLLDLGLVKLSAIGGYYKWANQINLFNTGTILRTEMNSAAAGVQAAAGLGPIDVELLYLKGLRNQLESLVVSNDVDTDWLELKGSIRLNEGVKAYVSYHTLGYTAGSVSDSLAGFGAGVTASF